MTLNIKHYFCCLILFLGSSNFFAQENPLLTRAFWKTNPSVEEVKVAVANGADATAFDRNYFDPTCFAILENASMPVMEYLLSFEGNAINKISHDERTYLFWASYRANLPLMQYLFDNGARMDLKDDKGNTVLIFTAGRGISNTKVYDMLVEHGADISAEKSRSGANALLLASAYMTDTTILNYFEKHGLSIESKDNNGLGLLDYMATTGNKEWIESYMKKGLSLNDQALFKAARGARNRDNSVAFFEFLLEQNLDATVLDEENNNILSYLAPSNKEVALHQLLIDKGVSPFADNKLNRSAFNMALARNNNTALSLYSKQEGLNTKNAELFNDLMSNTNLFEEKTALLEKMGVDFALANDKNQTVYHAVVNSGKFEFISWASKTGASINQKDDQGFTPLQLAVLKTDSVAVLKELIQLGADKTVTTEFEETIFDLAQENEKLKGENLDFLSAK